MDETEKAAELAATAEVKEDEVRAKVIEEFGFDEIDDAERIDKLTKKEVEHRMKLSQAIGQKIKHRTEADTLKNDPRLKTETKPLPVEPTATTEDPDAKLDAKLAERDLDDMNVSAALRKEIGDWAKFKGISVKQAALATHIATQIAEEKKADEVDDATISRTNRSGSKATFDPTVPPKTDMATVEGRKAYEEWKAKAIAAGG